MIGLVVRLIGDEIPRKYFEGSIPTCSIDASTGFQNFEEKISLRREECEISNFWKGSLVIKLGSN